MLGKLNAKNCGNIEFQKSVSTATTSQEGRPFNTEICEQSSPTIFWVANASMPFWLPNQYLFEVMLRNIVPNSNGVVNQIPCAR